MPIFGAIYPIIMALPELLLRYNQAIPRYTSYPTVPHWTAWDMPEDIVTGQSGAHERLRWEAAVRQTFRLQNKPDGLSLYLHLPYCEVLCTYCGCNKKITTNHSVEEPYIAALLSEWSLYLSLFPERPLIREIHLGGGTPTFFSAGNLARLISGLFEGADLHADFEFGFEGHPNNTSREQLQILFDHGFRRVSFGVQDLDPEVQRVINRIQPFEKLEEVTRAAREIGYDSVNFDLIYGLPKQHLTGLDNTIRRTLTLRPDRIAFYSYAHIPWKSRAQRLYDEGDLPSTSEKMNLYQLGRTLFGEAGYDDIGMDHFALHSDPLAIAARENRLHRNFMGYTTTQSRLLIGLGVSSISDAAIAYAQNTRELSTYLKQVAAGQWPHDRGYFLQKADQVNRRHILDIACTGSTLLDSDYVFSPAANRLLQQLLTDGLILFDGQKIQTTVTGRLFTRNVCSLFDSYLHGQSTTGPRYSKAV